MSTAESLDLISVEYYLDGELVSSSAISIRETNRRFFS